MPYQNFLPKFNLLSSLLAFSILSSVNLINLATKVPVLAQITQNPEVSAELIVKNQLKNEKSSNNIFGICLDNRLQNESQFLDFFEHKTQNLFTTEGSYNLKIVDLTYVYGAVENLSQFCSLPLNEYPVVASQEVNLSARTSTVLALQGSLEEEGSPWLVSSSWEIKETKASEDKSSGVQINNLNMGQIYPLSSLCVNGEFTGETKSGEGLFKLAPGQWDLSVPSINSQGAFCQVTTQNKQTVIVEESKILQLEVQVASDKFNPEFKYPNLKSTLNQLRLDLSANVIKSTQVAQPVTFQFKTAENTVQASLADDFLPQNGQVQFDKQSNTATYTPNPDFFGQDQFRINLQDETGAKMQIQCLVQVQPWKKDYFRPFPGE